MRLLTNNPRKIIGLEEGYGLKITKENQLKLNQIVNDSYLKQKRNWVTFYQRIQMKNNYNIVIVVSEFNKIVTDQLTMVPSVHLVKTVMVIYQLLLYLGL